MSRPRLAPALLTAAALVLAGCATAPGGDGPAEPSETRASETADDASEATDGEGPSTQDEAADTSDPDASDSGAHEAEVDADGEHSPDELSPDDLDVRAPESDSILAAECAEVPPPPMPHEIVSMEFTEVDGGFECITEVDSRGDSAYLTDEIAGQLDAAGHVQASRPPTDDAIDAVNTMSYFIGTDELHVTIRQNGATGVIIHYFLAPARGNG